MLALTGGVSYGFLSSFAKQAYAAGISTGPLTTMQNLLGAIFLWLIAWFVRSSSHQLSKMRVFKLLMVGTLSGLTGAFYYLSLAYLPASVAITLLFQFTWLGGLLDFLLEKKRPAGNQLLALLFIIPGTVLAVGLGQQDINVLPWQGIAFGLLSAITYTGFLYCTGRVVPDISPWIRSPIIVSGSLLASLVVFPPVYLAEGALGGDLLFWAALMAVFGQVIPTICFTKGVPVIGGSIAAIIGAVELPVVVVLAYFYLGEQVFLIQWIGMGVILLGVYISEWGWPLKTWLK